MKDPDEGLSMLRRLDRHWQQIEILLDFFSTCEGELGAWRECLPSFHGSIEACIECEEEQHFAPIQVDLQLFLYKHFGIDRDTLEKETRTLINNLVEPEEPA